MPDRVPTPPGHVAHGLAAWSHHHGEGGDNYHDHPPAVTVSDAWRGPGGLEPSPVDAGGLVELGDRAYIAREVEAEADGAELGAWLWLIVATGTRARAWGVGA